MIPIHQYSEAELVLAAAELWAGQKYLKFTETRTFGKGQNFCLPTGSP